MDLKFYVYNAHEYDPKEAALKPHFPIDLTLTEARLASIVLDVAYVALGGNRGCILVEYRGKIYDLKKIPFYVDTREKLLNWFGPMPKGEVHIQAVSSKDGTPAQTPAEVIGWVVYRPDMALHHKIPFYILAEAIRHAETMAAKFNLNVRHI